MTGIRVLPLVDPFELPPHPTAIATAAEIVADAHLRLR